MAEEDIYVSIKAEEAGIRAVQQMSSVILNLVNQIDAQSNRTRAAARSQADLNKAFGYGSDGARVYAKSLSEVRRNSAVINQYLKQNNMQLKAVQKAYNATGATASQSMGRVNSAIRSMTGRWRSAEKQVNSFGSTTVRNLANIQRQANQIRLTQQIQDFKSMSRAVLNVGKNMQYVGRNLTVGLTFPIVSFLRFGLDSFKKLSTEVVRFEKIASDSFVNNAEAYAQFNKELDGISDRYGVARELVQGVASDFATVGIPETAISDLVQLSAEVEKLGDVTMEESRQFVQALLFQSLTVQRSEQGFVDYGLAVEQVAGQLAMFNAIENNTVVTMNMVAKAIPEMQAVTTQFGLSLNEATAAFAPMIAAGFEVGASGNSIKVSLQRLVAPAKQNKEILEELAQSIGGFNFNVGVGIESVSELARSFVALEKTKGAQGALELYARLFGVRQGSRMLQAFKELAYFQEELSDSSSGSFKVVNTIVDNVNKAVQAAGLSQRYQATSIADLSQISRDSAAAYASGNTVLLKAIESGQDAAVNILEAGGKKMTDEIDSQAGRILTLQAAGRGKSGDIYTAELEKALETPAVKLARAREQFKKISRELIPPLVDALEGLIPYIKRFADFLANLNEKTIRNIALMLGLAAAVGPVITAFSNLLQTAGFLGGALTKLAGGFSMLFNKSGQILPAAMFDGIRNLDVFGKKLSRLNEGYYYYAGSMRKLNKEMERVAKTGSRVFGADPEDAMRNRMRRRRLFEREPGQAGFMRRMMPGFFGSVQQQANIEGFNKHFTKAIKNANANIGKFLVSEGLVQKALPKATGAIDSQVKSTKRKTKATSAVKDAINQFNIVERKTAKEAGKAASTLNVKNKTLGETAKKASAATKVVDGLAASQTKLAKASKAATAAMALPAGATPLALGPGSPVATTPIPMSPAGAVGKTPIPVSAGSAQVAASTAAVKSAATASYFDPKVYEKYVSKNLKEKAVPKKAMKFRNLEAALGLGMLGKGTDDSFAKLISTNFKKFDDEVMRALFARAGRLEDFSKEVRAVTSQPAFRSANTTPGNIKKMLNALRATTQGVDGKMVPTLFPGGNIATLQKASDLPAVLTSKSGKGVQGTSALGRPLLNAVKSVFDSAKPSTGQILSTYDIQQAAAKTARMDDLQRRLPTTPRVGVKDMLPSLESDLAKARAEEVARTQRRSGITRRIQSGRSSMLERIAKDPLGGLSSEGEQAKYKRLQKSLATQSKILSQIRQVSAASVADLDDRISTVNKQMSSGKTSIGKDTFLKKDSKYSTEATRSKFRQLEKNIRVTKKAMKDGSVSDVLGKALLKRYETDQKSLLRLSNISRAFASERSALLNTPVKGLGDPRRIESAMKTMRSQMKTLEQSAARRAVRVKDLYDRAFYDADAVKTLQTRYENPYSGRKGGVGGSRVAQTRTVKRGRGLSLFDPTPRSAVGMGISDDFTRQEDLLKELRRRSIVGKGNAKAPLMNLKDLTFLASSKVKGIEDVMRQATRFDEVVSKQLGQVRSVATKAGMKPTAINNLMSRVVSDLMVNMQSFSGGTMAEFERMVKNSITRTTMGGTSMMAGGTGKAKDLAGLQKKVVKNLIDDELLGLAKDQSILEEHKKLEGAAREANQSTKQQAQKRIAMRKNLINAYKNLNPKDFIDDAVRQIGSTGIEKGGAVESAKKGMNKTSKATDLAVRAQQNFERAIVKELFAMQDELQAGAAVVEKVSAPVEVAVSSATASMSEYGRDIAEEALQITAALNSGSAIIDNAATTAQASIVATGTMSAGALAQVSDTYYDISKNSTGFAFAVNAAGETVQVGLMDMAVRLASSLDGVAGVYDTIGDIATNSRIVVNAAGETVKPSMFRATIAAVNGVEAISDEYDDIADVSRQMRVFIAAVGEASKVDLATSGVMIGKSIKDMTGEVLGIARFMGVSATSARATMEQALGRATLEITAGTGRAGSEIELWGAKTGSIMTGYAQIWGPMSTAVATGTVEVASAAEIARARMLEYYNLTGLSVNEVADSFKAVALDAKIGQQIVDAQKEKAGADVIESGAVIGRTVNEVADSFDEIKVVAKTVEQAVEIAVAEAKAKIVESGLIFAMSANELGEYMKEVAFNAKVAFEIAKRAGEKAQVDAIEAGYRIYDSIDDVGKVIERLGGTTMLALGPGEAVASKSEIEIYKGGALVRKSYGELAVAHRKMSTAIVLANSAARVQAEATAAQAAASAGGGGGGGRSGRFLSGAGGAARGGAKFVGDKSLGGLQKLLGMFKSLNMAILGFGAFALKAFALLTLGIGPVIVGIVALVMAIKNLVKASSGSDEIRQRFRKAFIGIKNLLKGLLKPITDTINGFFGIDTTTKSAKVSMSTFAGVLTAVFEKLGAVAQRLANSEGFKSFQKAATSALTQIINIVITLAKVIKNLVTGDTGEAGQLMIQVFMRVGYAILGVLTNLEDAFKGFAKFLINANAIAFKLVVRLGVEAFQALWNAIKNIDWAGLALAIGKTLAEGIMNGVTGAGAQRDFVMQMVEEGYYTREQAAEMLGVDSLEAAIADMDVSGIRDAAGSAIGDAMSSIELSGSDRRFANMPGFGAEFEFNFSTGIDSLDNLIDGLVDTAIGGVDGAVGALMSVLSGARNSLREDFQERFDMDIEAPIRLVSEDTAAAIQETVKEIEKGIANAMDQGGEELVDDISNGIGDAMKDAFQKFVDLVTDYLGEQIDKVKDKFKEALEEQRDGALSFFDDQIAAIEALEEAEEKLYKKQKQIEEDRQRDRDRALQQENYRRDRALAIYEGRVDDARMLDLQEVKNSQDFKDTSSRISEERLREEQKNQRDILKSILKEQKDAAKKTFDDIINQFVDYVENIGDLGTLNQEQLEEQFQKIADEAGVASDKMLDSFRGYYTDLPALIDQYTDPTVGFFSTSLGELLAEANKVFGIGREAEDTTTILGTTAVMLGDMGGLIEAAGLDSSFTTALNKVPASITSGFNAEGEDTIKGAMQSGIDSIAGIIEDFDPAKILEDAYAKANATILAEYQKMVNSTVSLTAGLVEGLDPAVAKLIALEAAAKSAGEAIGNMPSGVQNPFADYDPTNILENPYAFADQNIVVNSSLAEIKSDKATVELPSSAETAKDSNGNLIFFAKGGMVKGYASGGRIPSFAPGGIMTPGFGSTGMPAILHGGEFVLNKRAVETVGVTARMLDALNKQRFSTKSVYEKEIQKAMDQGLSDSIVKVMRKQLAEAMLHLEQRQNDFIASTGAITGDTLKNVSKGVIDNGFKIAVPRTDVGSGITNNYNTTNTTNIYVDNFIGEDEWFRSMLKEYNIKHKQIDDRRYNIGSPVYTTYKGASFN